MEIPSHQRGRYFGEHHSPYKKRYQRKKYEVFFRHVFTSAYPHKETDALKHDLVIPVYRLSHITHDKEAALITANEGLFTFLPKRKVGKAYETDGSPLGESFRDNFLTGHGQVDIDPEEQMYRCIPNTESLMPEGYYSWWGITTKEWLDDNQDILSLCQEPLRPSYLQKEPASPYGNNEFSGELQQMLLSYRNAHSPAPDAADEVKLDVYLLLGGTLRYTKEICCVVIVCTEHHRHSEALRNYQPLSVGTDIDPHHPTLVLRDLTDESGKIVDYSGWCIPEFHPMYISSGVSWANLAFAFYFDSPDTKFVVGDLWHRPIEHTRCVKKQPPPHRGDWVCPNDLHNQQN